MRQKDTNFSGAGGTRISYRSWLPDHIKASVVVAHGLGEHGGRYAHVAEALTKVGCAVYAIDHRGHGKSDGPRALVDRFSNAVADMDTLVESVRKELPQLPVFVLGHSMGGALSLNYTLEHGEKLAGLMLSGPAVALSGMPAPVRFVMKLLATVAPKLGTLLIDPSLVSRDAQMVALYSSDSLNCHGKVPVRTLGELIRFAEQLPSRLAEISLPILAMHGRDDKLVPCTASQMVHDKVSSKDKTLRIYDGLYHEIFNELPLDRARVIADMTKWVEAHMGP